MSGCAYMGESISGNIKEAVLLRKTQVKIIKRPSSDQPGHDLRLPIAERYGITGII